MCDIDNVTETSLTAAVPRNGQEISIGRQKGLFHQAYHAVCFSCMYSCNNVSVFFVIYVQCVVNVISYVLVQILLLVCHVSQLVQPAVVDQR